jgi:hypothetical protein
MTGDICDLTVLPEVAPLGRETLGLMVSPEVTPLGGDMAGVASYNMIDDNEDNMVGFASYDSNKIDVDTKKVMEDNKQWRKAKVEEQEGRWQESCTCQEGVTGQQWKWQQC